MLSVKSLGRALARVKGRDDTLEPKGFTGVQNGCVEIPNSK